jgi:hypothetical protein
MIEVKRFGWLKMLFWKRVFGFLSSETRLKSIVRTTKLRQKRRASLRLRRKFIRVRSDPRRLCRYQAGDPLWPLEELHDLHKPPFVAEPEFTPFDIDALLLFAQKLASLWKRLNECFDCFGGEVHRV